MRADARGLPVLAEAARRSGVPDRAAATRKACLPEEVGGAASPEAAPASSRGRELQRGGESSARGQRGLTAKESPCDSPASRR